MENSLEKKQRVNLLMDLYEDLLTEKQREYLDLYYHEDLSLSEISLIKNVSKNAVFDNLKKACLHLENYEEKLNLLEKHQKRLEIIDDFHGYVTIEEGKYHQIKKMFLSLKNEVISLKRISFDEIYLDEDLLEGMSRPLNKEERNKLIKKAAQC